MNYTLPADVANAHIRLFNWRNLARIDWVLTVLVLLLAFAGILVLYSANRSASSETPYYVKQLMFIPVGVVLALIIMCIDHRFLGCL